MPNSRAVHPDRHNPGRRPGSESRTDAIGHRLDEAANLTRRGIPPEESAKLVEIARLMRESKIDEDEAARRLGYS